MDNEFIDVPIDGDEAKLESQDSCPGSQISEPSTAVYPSLPPLAINVSPSTLNKISFHLTEQVQSSAITQYYENISYVVHSQVNDGPSNQVIRKYTHFEWLNAALKRELPGILVPAIPPKSVLAKINFVEATYLVREKRFRQLVEFLFKVKNHPKMQQSKKLEIFLTGSSDILQQELSELTQYQSYAQQMGSAIFNVGSKAMDIAKGSFSYLSSFIYTQPTQQQLLYPELEIAHDVKELFESWEDLLFEEQQKIKRIYEYFISIVNIKLEQNEEMKKITLSIQDLTLSQLEKNIKKTQASAYLNETILNDIKLSVLFKMELCVFDLDEALGIIRKRSELVQLIQQEIRMHNQNESFSEKLSLKEQIRENQKQLRLLESNFQSDIKEFAKWLNEYITQLIGTYNDLFQRLYVEQQKNWCE